MVFRISLILEQTGTKRVGFHALEFFGEKKKKSKLRCDELFPKFKVPPSNLTRV